MSKTQSSIMNNFCCVKLVVTESTFDTPQLKNYHFIEILHLCACDIFVHHFISYILYMKANSFPRNNLSYM